MPKIASALKKKLVAEADKFVRIGIFPSTFKSEEQCGDDLSIDSPYIKYKTVPFVSYESDADEKFSCLDLKLTVRS